MKKKQSLWQLLALFATLILVSGCGDSNVFSSVSNDASAAAVQDQGVQALNAGDYQEAVALFEELYAENPNDPEVQKYLASAYVGRAGFEMLTLIEAIADNQETGVSGQSVVFSTVNDLVGFQNGTIALETLDAKIGDVSSALEVLIPTGSSPAHASADARFQAGLYAAVQTVLVTEEVLGGVDPAVLSDAEIATTVGSGFAEREGELEQSLTLVSAARDDLVANLTDGTESNDLGTDFDQMLLDIGFDDSDLTAEELTLFLQTQ